MKFLEIIALEGNFTCTNIMDIPKKNESLSQKAYNWIFDRLIRGKFKPGDVLKRRDLAAKMNISLAPVSEAVIRLENEGFLVTRPRHGTLVNKIDELSIRDIYIFRIAIEVQAARLYCGKISEGDYRKIMKIAEELDEGDPFINWKPEIDFHSALVDLANIPTLSAAFKNVMRHHLFYSVNAVFPIGNIKNSSHVNLLNILMTASPDDAEKVVREHISKRISLIS